MIYVLTLQVVYAQLISFCRNKIIFHAAFTFDDDYFLIIPYNYNRDEKRIFFALMQQVNVSSNISGRRISPQPKCFLRNQKRSAMVKIAGMAA